MNYLKMRKKTLKILRHERLTKIVNETYTEEIEEKRSNEGSGEEEELMFIRLLEENARLKEVNSFNYLLFFI